jgi:predicted oxidoreductase
MKFEIDVKDFWLEEGEISEALAAHITKTVVAQISKSIEDRVQAGIATRVDAVVKERISKIIADKLDDLVETGVIMVDRKEMKIADHLRQVFENHIGWSSPRDQIARLADAFGKDLKTRFDAAFANRIVVKLNEQGMLKDEVVRLLIS